VRIGTTWIEAEDYEKFIYELLNTPRRARVMRSQYYDSGIQIHFIALFSRNHSMLIIYQDVCYPVTKEFREKLYGEVMKTYEEEKEKKQEEQQKMICRKRKKNQDSFCVYIKKLLLVRLEQ